MARNIEPKCKQCRRVGEKLMLKGDRCNTQKCAITKRNYAPGMHGPKGKKKSSEFSLQLIEKQKAKKQYHLMEKQFKLAFAKSKKKSGNTAENFFQLLETRLDNVIYRLGWATSRSQARQLVSHKHFLVNDRSVNIPSYIVKSSDTIKVKPKSEKYKHFKEVADKQKKQTTPSWLNVTSGELTAKVLHEPKAGDIESNINVQMIVEFYSR
jgi:small subunit ribosomal protein S4